MQTSAIVQDSLGVLNLLNISFSSVDEEKQH